MRGTWTGSGRGTGAVWSPTAGGAEARCVYRDPAGSSRCPPGAFGGSAVEEIRAAGYTQLKAYVQGCGRSRSQWSGFETPAGRQAQVDFARFRFHWGVRYALLVVLGYSRGLWLRFYRRQDLRTLLGGLEEAFAFFGGVAQELLFDQIKSVITKDLRLLGGDLVRNAELLRFAGQYGGSPHAPAAPTGRRPRARTHTAPLWRPDVEVSSSAWYVPL